MGRQARKSSRYDDPTSSIRTTCPLYELFFWVTKVSLSPYLSHPTAAAAAQRGGRRHGDVPLPGRQDAVPVAVAVVSRADVEKEGSEDINFDQSQC